MHGELNLFHLMSYIRLVLSGSHAPQPRILNTEPMARHLTRPVASMVSEPPQSIGVDGSALAS